MDRDYTTEKEQKHIGFIESLTSENNNCKFDQLSSGLTLPSVETCHETYQDIYATSNYYYENIGYRTRRVFQEVRCFDANFAGEETLQDDLNILKNNMQRARDLLSLSSLGKSVSEINYNLGRYGSAVALEGSIFGNDLSYAGIVEAIGFTEQAANSKAYYEQAFATVFIYVDGKPVYDMAAIEKILAKDASEITNAEYIVIAMAYTMMNEKDMETLFCDMMTLSDTCNYTWGQEHIGGPMVGNIKKDYYEWSIDDDKWNGFMQGLSLISTYNAQLVNVLQQDALVDQNIVENRYQLVQKEAIAQAIYNVHEFRNSYGEDRPYLNITCEGENNKTYIINFKEEYITSMLGTLNSLHTSQITVGQSRSGVTSAAIVTDHVMVDLHNHFAPNFTSVGFSSPEAQQTFIAEHMFSFLLDVAGEGIDAEIEEAFGGNIPVVGNLISDGIGAMEDYYQGVEDATALEAAADELMKTNLYSYFDCAVSITNYQTNNISGEYLYADAGIQTIQIINDYNDMFDTEITIPQLLNDPYSVNEDYHLRIEEENAAGTDGAHFSR